MRKLSIFVAGFVTILLAFLILPPFVIYLIGCYQIGSWVGDFISNKVNEDF